MNRRRINKIELFSIILLSVVFSCNENEKDLTDPFRGKWIIEEIYLNDLTGNIQVLTNDYEKCVVDDILEFDMDRQLSVNEGGKVCPDFTYPYFYQLDLTIDSQGKVVGFQILPVYGQVYHPLVATSDYFFVESANVDSMEISTQTRCDNQEVCRRIIKLKRL